MIISHLHQSNTTGALDAFSNSNSIFYSLKFSPPPTQPTIKKLARFDQSCTNEVIPDVFNSASAVIASAVSKRFWSN